MSTQLQARFSEDMMQQLAGVDTLNIYKYVYMYLYVYIYILIAEAL
jgi:hypothetical protein